jgi:hypothetical protein
MEVFLKPLFCNKKKSKSVKKNGRDLVEKMMIFPKRKIISESLQNISKQLGQCDQPPKSATEKRSGHTDQFALSD